MHRHPTAWQVSVRIQGRGGDGSMGEQVRLELTADEALVLFDFLSRFSDTDVLAVEDKAEQRALWNVCCLLEKQLVEPFLANYDQLLRQARDRLRDPVE